MFSFLNTEAFNIFSKFCRNILNVSLNTISDFSPPLSKENLYVVYDTDKYRLS
jgi:hypothetical protein